LTSKKLNRHVNGVIQPICTEMDTPIKTSKNIYAKIAGGNMSDKTTLGDRFKKYEEAYKILLPQRMPIIIRVDGKAFHAYTKPLTKQTGKAFDTSLEEVMNITAIKLCEEIQGAQIAYVQSDEISILVHGYKKFTSQGWFDNKLQKIVSVSAAIASSTFTVNSEKIWNFTDEGVYFPNIRPAYFDSRAFVLPEGDVCNYFLWRQQDAVRNSVQMLARSLYSHKECYKKNNSELQEMTFSKGRNWNNEPTSFKRGRCIIRLSVSQGVGGVETSIQRKKWKVDNEIPTFSQDQDYINRFLCVEE